MRKSGVLKAEQMPKLGGEVDTPKLELPVRALRDWDKLRKSRAGATAKATGSKKVVGKQPSSADGSTTSLLSTARSWDNVGHIGAKRWRLD